MTSSPRQPIRTCVGCGQKVAQSALVRFAADAGRVVFGRSGGRGAWLHPVEACLDRALERRAFARVLRAQGVLADARALRVELTGSARKD